MLWQHLKITDKFLTNADFKKLVTTHRFVIATISIK